MHVGFVEGSMTRFVVPLVLLVGTALAQFNSGSAALVGHVRVQVLFTDNAHCDPATRVELSGMTGMTVDESTVNAQCVAEFFAVPAGNYQLTVTGAEVASADSVDFSLSSGMTHEVEVHARRTGAADAIPSYATSAFVSVRELSVPPAAEKEFEKANRLIVKRDWVKATGRLRRAIAIYPQYAAAYNNLGAVYARMGQIPPACEALKKAIALDEHMAMAYVNLGRVSFTAREFPAVEAFVGKALSLAAPDADELTLLAFAQVADQHLDQAIETSRQAHRSQLNNHAYLHVVAAKANELQGKDDAAVAELQQYLSEEPTGKRSERVRAMLAKFQMPPEVR
jgi:tetratricopeptide (TPR) repeat protein